MRVKMVPGLILAAVVFLIGQQGAFAENLYDERPYEPVVILAQNAQLQAFRDVPVDEIYLYSYKESTGWVMMPFQIDEQTLGPDPINPAINRWFYFIPEFWADSLNITSHDGLFNGHDELAFMIRDLGDKAPEKSWIDNDESQFQPRVELVVQDPDNPNIQSYAYLYRSSSITEAVPKPYNFEYFAEQDRIETAYYALGLNEMGLIKDILVKEPGGSGQDIFDALKIRFKGVIDTFIPIPIVATDSLFILLEEPKINNEPIVRLIRNVKQSIKIGAFVSPDVAFRIEAIFYPYGGTFGGGAKLTPEDLKRLFPDGEVSILLENIRQSWDYNSNAVGMKFFNKYNDNIRVDGIMEVIDKTLDINPENPFPINEWSLLSGDQGSVFTIINFEDSRWVNSEIYYYDNLNGGTADWEIFDTEDTGDGKSFGDNGILLQSADPDSVNLELNLLAFFLPEKNLQKSDGEKLVSDVRNPVTVTSTVLTDVKNREQGVLPEAFVLYQNYPNPFNASTLITFYLPVSQRVALTIYDVTGRLVSTLVNEKPGSGFHKVLWNGLNNQDRPVPSGVYYYKIESGDFSQTKKLVLLR